MEIAELDDEGVKKNIKKEKDGKYDPRTRRNTVWKLNMLNQPKQFYLGSALR